MKMRVLRITFVVFVIVCLRVGCLEEIGDDFEKKDGKGGFLPGSVRRTTTQSSVNGTRDSQLLSLLAARRRQLLSERLASHVNTIASLAHKANKTNTTFASLEIKDSNNSTLKRLTFENTSNDAPTLKLVTNDGSREIHQDIKPHEIRHLFIPKTYQDNKSRSAFLNNRRKPTKPAIFPDRNTEPSILYVPPDKLEEYEKEIELDPDEEFQVDESNHGLYLLNYSDTENVTQSPNVSISTIATTPDSKEVVANTSVVPITTENVITTTVAPATTKQEEKEEEKPEINTITNNTKLSIKEIEKYIDNQTQFLTAEIFKHFRPLESELSGEEMAPFLHFGDKLGGGVINDNLTNSPSLSASTKSVNFIVAPGEKRKYNSRYSATEKYKNTSADEEEEVNEDMDVSVVKNVIEKNKVRNTVKGPAPGRLGVVNAYRKYSSTTPASFKAPNIGQLNVTEPIVSSVTPNIFEGKENNNTNSTTIKKDLSNKMPINTTAAYNNTKETTIKVNVTTPQPRNYTRTYYNLRRRPSKLTTSPTESIQSSPVVNSVVVNTTTTEKASTVYTAVVTSVSITSSMKGQNKTEAVKDSGDVNVTTTLPLEVVNVTTPSTVINETEEVTTTTTSTEMPSSTPRNFRHRIRIRTSTTESSLGLNPTAHPLTSALPNQTVLNIETVPKLAAPAVFTFQPNDYINTTLSSTIRPKNVVRRRRPTTTTTTTTEIPTTISSTIYVLPTSSIITTQVTIQPTTKAPSESTSKSLLTAKNNTENQQNITVDDLSVTQNEEVVIEAEKTYTASYVLAGLGFLPVAAIIAFVLRSILNKKTKEIDTEYEGYFDEGGEIKKETSITPVARPPLPTPTNKPDQKWEFPRNKLRLQTLLGQGNFGQVWKAEADDLNGHDGLTRLVAVKSIKETATQKEKQELLHEIYIMQKIGTHPNVVTLLACCTEQEPYLLIMEYVMCGKLLTYLRERRSRPDRFSGSGALTSRDLTVFAYCVARGMDYIATKGIVHRDLAARNVLVDHNKLCKIADFGMSRVRGAGTARGARGALPVRWCAPEALLYNVYTSQTDVWAFGILLWEIVTLGSTPYAAMSGREVLAAVTEGYRLERPAHCAPALFRAMHACWHADPAQRPSFASLKSQLAELLDNEPSDGNYVDLDSFYQESSVYSDPSAIINDEEGLSAEYDRERRVFRELAKGPSKFENRAFNLREEEMRNKFGIGTPRMGGFGIRDVPFNERTFSDGEFNDRNYNEKNFPDKNFNDTNFTERKDGKLSTSSFHRERERERENPLVSRNSFNGFPRIGTRDTHFQLSPDGRNKRVSEFECDI